MEDVLDLSLDLDLLGDVRTHGPELSLNDQMQVLGSGDQCDVGLLQELLLVVLDGGILDPEGIELLAEVYVDGLLDLLDLLPCFLVLGHPSLEFADHLLDILFSRHGLTNRLSS